MFFKIKAAKRIRWRLQFGVLRKIERSRLISSLNLDPNEEYILLFKIRGQLGVSLSLKSLSKNEYIRQHQLADITHFFYLGLIFSLGIYSLFFFASLKDASFAYYSLFGISIGVSDLVYSGFLSIGTAAGEYGDKNTPCSISPSHRFSLFCTRSLSMLKNIASFLKTLGKAY